MKSRVGGRLTFAILTLGSLLLTQACHQVKPPAHLLRLSLDPPQLEAGVPITLSARPEPPTELTWVSGTVEVMGAPTLPMRFDPSDGAWKFRSMIPAFMSVPSGVYKVKAWGMSKNGIRAEGELSVRVE